MAWQNIPNNPNWQYNDSPPDPGANSPLRSLWQKQTNGIRDFKGHKVYTQVRKITDPTDNNFSAGELSKTYWDSR